MNRITKEFKFCASHRIEGHPKCGRMHGHNYRVVVGITGQLDSSGMVMDYGVMKQLISPIIDEMDHKFLISQANMEATNDPRHGYVDVATSTGDAYILIAQNSTAEELCIFLHRRIFMALKMTPNRVDVAVFEQDGSEAFYQG